MAPGSYNARWPIIMRHVFRHRIFWSSMISGHSSRSWLNLMIIRFSSQSMLQTADTLKRRTPGFSDEIVEGFHDFLIFCHASTDEKIPHLIEAVAHDWHQQRIFWHPRGKIDRDLVGLDVHE